MTRSSLRLGLLLAAALATGLVVTTGAVRSALGVVSANLGNLQLLRGVDSFAMPNCTTPLLSPAAGATNHQVLLSAGQRFADALHWDPANGRALLGLGRASWLREDYQGGIDWLGMAARSPSTERLARFDLGSVFTMAGDHERGTAEWQKGEAVGYFLNRGALYERCGRWGQALEAYRLAAQIRPDSAEARRGMGLAIYRGGGNWQEARDHFAAAIDLDPQLLDAYLKLGTILEERSYWRDAASWWSLAIANLPDADAPRAMLGRNYVYQGKYAEAIKELGLALALAPENPYTYSYLGLAYARAGDNEQAAAMYRTAIRLDAPSDPSVLTWRIQLARVYTSLGQTERAAQEYAEVLRAAPGNPTALGELQSLAPGRR